MNFQANRSAGAWYLYILESLGTLHSPDALQTFITVGVGGGDPAENDEEPAAWIQDETSRLEIFVRLLIELASARAWSQMMYTNCQPNSFVGILHPQQTLAKQLFTHQHGVWEGVLHAEKCLHDPDLSPKIGKDIKKELEKRLDDVCWHELQLAREIFIVCASCDWDISNHDVLQLARRIFGVPWNTKFDLEDLFAHLASVSKMTSLATAMGKPLALNNGMFW